MTVERTENDPIEDDYYSDFGVPFEGSDLARECAFCAVMEGVDPDRTIIYVGDLAAFIMSKKDGHPLFLPIQHMLGDETDEYSRKLKKATEDLVGEQLDRVMKIYREQHGATGFSVKYNFGTQQNIKHFHIHVEAWRGGKDEEQIILDRTQRTEFRSVFLREIAPEGLLNVPRPMHQ